MVPGGGGPPMGGLCPSGARREVFIIIRLQVEIVVLYPWQQNELN